MSMFHRMSRRIEYIVVDAGIGIPRTLRQSHPDLSSDTAALERAIREGVTRDENLGQGNGLYGSYQVCSHSNGVFISSRVSRNLLLQAQKDSPCPPRKCRSRARL